MALNVTLKVPYKEGPDTKIKKKPVKKIEEDLLTRLIVAEAGNQPEEGKIAVANVVMNRLNSPLPYLTRGGKRTISNVIQNPNAFESYTNKKMFDVQKDSVEYQEANLIAKKAIQGDLDDVTNGATHFLNPKVIMDRGDNLPSWYYNLEKRGIIGDHEFFYEGIRK
tara:strand:- start:81 stop:578 length:498 start_codon:yes stop_codon:yes gene_type:complete